MIDVYFGHHKAASTWISLILEDLAASLRFRTLTVHSVAAWDGHRSLGDFVSTNSPNLLIFTNAVQADANTLPPTRGFHVIRDPRDIIVSGYFSHRYSHSEAGWPELPPHRRALTRLDLDAGLSSEIEFSGRFIDHLSTWNYSQPTVLELRMEDLIANPVANWQKIVAHLQWPLDEAGASVSLNEVVGRYSFAQLAGGREPGSLDVTHHYRRGVAGDWRNYLNSKHLAQVRARYGDLVERLGYQW